MQLIGNRKYRPRGHILFHFFIRSFKNGCAMSETSIFLVFLIAIFWVWFVSIKNNCLKMNLNVQKQRKLHDCFFVLKTEARIFFVFFLLRVLAKLSFKHFFTECTLEQFPRLMGRIKSCLDAGNIIVRQFLTFAKKQWTRSIFFIRIRNLVETVWSWRKTGMKLSAKSSSCIMAKTRMLCEVAQPQDGQ